MKLFKYILTAILALFFPLLLSSQTLQQGRDLFSAGDYETAMPIILKYLKQSPENASRNYWYGVCLYETGNKSECIKYLEKAAKKKIIKAYKYMGLYYTDLHDYPAAMDNYTKFISGMKADKALHDEAIEAEYEQRIDSLRMTYRLFRNTSKVCFIDSFAVAKDNFLETYVLDASAGSIATLSDVFGDDMPGDVFSPEIGSEIYFSKQANDSARFQLYKAYDSPDGWSDITRIGIGNEECDIRYPFVMSDGVTIYYAATGPESLGGYDIFVTRYNPGTEKYLKPENVGMPFNSGANDYMYVIDEFNGLGWFATDRNQPEDSVCIYVFIPDESRPKYDIEQDSIPAIARAAELASIEETQDDPIKVRTLRQKLTILSYNKLSGKANNDFAFVIDDFTDYHSADDFRNSEARDMFTKWQDMRKRLNESQLQLERKRSEWSESNSRERESRREALLKLEQDTEELERNVRDTEIRIRNTEIEYLSH